MEKPNDEEAIINHILTDGEAKLTKPQKEKFERLCFADDVIRRYRSRTKVISFIVSKFGVSKSTAKNDYYSAQQVFGTTAKHNKEYHIDLLLESIEETRRMARATNNATALARCDANHANAIEKLLGDKDTIDYSEVQLPALLLVTDPSLLENKQLPEAELKKQIQQLSRVDKEARQLPKLNFSNAEDIHVLFENNDED